MKVLDKDEKAIYNALIKDVMKPKHLKPTKAPKGFEEDVELAKKAIKKVRFDEW